MVNDLGQSFQEVISRVSLDYETTGNGYLEIVRAMGGKRYIEEFYHVPSSLIKRQKRGADFPFIYRNTGEATFFHAYTPDKKPPGTDHNEILQFQNYTDRSRYYGLPDWRGTVPDIEVDYYAVLYNQKFFC